MEISRTHRLLITQALDFGNMRFLALAYLPCFKYPHARILNESPHSTGSRSSPECQHLLDSPPFVRTPRCAHAGASCAD